MQPFKFFGIFLFILINTISVKGTTILFSNNTNTPMEIGSSIMILEDPSGKLSFTDALRSSNYKQSTNVSPNLGVTSSSFWIKFEIKNLSNSEELLLEFAQPTIDEITFYNALPDERYAIVKSGENLGFINREYNHQNFIFKLIIPKGKSYTYLMKVRSTGEIQIPLSLGLPESIFESIDIKDLISGIYFGIILVMIFYNLFIYLIVKDKSYLYYVVYILFVGLVQASLQGYTYKYFWPNSPWIASQSIIIMPALSGFAAISFLRNFLLTEKFIPTLDKGLLAFVVTYTICIILSVTGAFNISFQILQLNSLLISLYILFIGYKISRKGYRPAKFFLLGWSMFLGGVFIFVLKNVGILPYNTFTYYSLQMGSALEVMLLSFALADRINILKKEKEDSQAEALKALQENENIIKQQNVILDIKVTERTEELQQSNKELNLTLKNLKETQSKLVDAEKMASLGQLTAGIAHEINNPINFVSSSVKPLKRDFLDLLSILDKYDEISKDGNAEQGIKEVNNLKKELDLEYLKEEINILLNGIDDGANRTAEIVKGLRNFSRMDEDDLKLVNIHEGIDSSLVLLNSTLGKIDIIKEYGKIPSIECFAGKLNQVFMNILINATHAINSKKETSDKGQITIKTYEKGPNLVVSIKDSGIGMTEEVKNKVFEPFFTTKAVGEGTGLGLSIVFSIIEAHKGRIEVLSEIGKGTEFIITLPKTQKK